MTEEQKAKLASIKEKMDIIGYDVIAVEDESSVEPYEQHRLITLNKPDGEKVKSNVNVLQLENMSKRIEYHCNDGFCGKCQCKLVKGVVAQPKDVLAYVRPGNFLACKSKILSKNIEFENNTG